MKRPVGFLTVASLFWLTYAGYLGTIATYAIWWLQR
jgi:hypothetical protein